MLRDYSIWSVFMKYVSNVNFLAAATSSLSRRQCLLQLTDTLWKFQSSCSGILSSISGCPACANVKREDCLCFKSDDAKESKCPRLSDSQTLFECANTTFWGHLSLSYQCAFTWAESFVLLGESAHYFMKILVLMPLLGRAKHLNRLQQPDWSRYQENRKKCVKNSISYLIWCFSVSLPICKESWAYFNWIVVYIM